MNQNITTPLTPMLYVCVMSGYNIAEFESCLHHKPSHVLLIVSNLSSAQEGATRFESQLRAELPDVVIIRPDNYGEHSFLGSSFKDTQRWVQEILISELNKHSLPMRCNITGGTKAIILALSDPDLGWEKLDYKGESTKGLQVLVFDERNKLKTLEVIPSIEPASPISVAKINSNKVDERQDNPIFQHPSSAKLALNLWTALTNNETGLLDLFGNEYLGFEKVWAHDRENPLFKEKFLTFSAQEFIGKEQFSEQSLSWLQQWHELAPTSLSFTESSITFPGNKGSNTFRRWLTGDWLEQLAAVWITEQISAKHIATNLKVNTSREEKSSTGERETDIVVHYNESTSIIEVKTDMPPQGGLKELLNQITTFGDRIGRTNKVLFIGPQLSQKLSTGYEKDYIEKVCKAEGVKLADSKASLFKAIKLPPSH